MNSKMEWVRSRIFRWGRYGWEKSFQDKTTHTLWKNIKYSRDNLMHVKTTTMNQTFSSKPQLKKHKTRFFLVSLKRVHTG